MSAASGQSQRIAGLVLAAGRSRRMGVLKQTLPWSVLSEASGKDSTIVAAAFDAIAPHCEGMHVIVGRDADAVIAALEGRRFTRIDSDSEDEMFASVRAGLRAIVELADADEPVTALLLQPGDHPGVMKATIDRLLDAHAHDPTRAIMPEHRGKGGHPALIPIGIARTILEWGMTQTGGGLRQFWIEHAHLRSRIEVDDASCIVDLDTPAEYEVAHQAALTAWKHG